MRSDLVLWNRSHAPSPVGGRGLKRQNKPFRCERVQRDKFEPNFHSKFYCQWNFTEFGQKRAVYFWKCVLFWRFWPVGGRGQHFEGYLTARVGSTPFRKRPVTPIKTFSQFRHLWGNWKQKRAQWEETMKGTNTETHATNENEKRVFVLRLGFLN